MAARLAAGRLAPGPSARPEGTGWAAINGSISTAKSGIEPESIIVTRAREPMLRPNRAS